MRARAWVPRGTRVLAALLGTAVLAVACATGTPARPPEDGLTIYNSYEISGLDPAGASTNWLYDWGVAENLLQVDDQARIQPWLAESVVATTPTVWTVALRPALRFQNGRPLDAAVAARALNRQLAENKAVRQYLPAGTAVAATGPLTLTVTTPSPNTAVPAAMAARDTSLQIYDPDAVEAAGGDSSRIVHAGAFTGPFTMTDWTPWLLSLVRNDGYWGGRPRLPRVTIKVVDDEQARLAGVQSGEAQLAFYPSIQTTQALRGRTDAVVRSSPSALQSLLIDMNLTAAPFDDVRVRQAYRDAIDYRALAVDGFDPATGLYPADAPYAVTTQQTDLGAAAVLLDQAGWAPGPDGIRTRDGRRLAVRFITQSQGPETAALAVLIKDQVAKAGFDLQIADAEDSAAVKKDLRAWDSSIGLNGSLSATGDPVQPFRDRWTSSGSANAGRIADPRVDGIGAALIAAPDGPARDALLREGQRILSGEQADVIAATFKRFVVVAGGAWTGYRVSNVRRHLRADTGP